MILRISCNDTLDQHESTPNQYRTPKSQEFNITSQIQDHLPIEVCHTFEGKDSLTVFHCWSVQCQ